MTIETLIRSVKSLSHEEIDQDLDSAVVVASVNRGIRTLDDLHSRQGTINLHAFQTVEDIRQTVYAGEFDETVKGADALSLVRDGDIVCRFRWVKDGEEKSLVATITANTVLLCDLLGETPEEIRITLESGVLRQFIALSCRGYTKAGQIPLFRGNRVVYDMTAYTDDFLSFVNTPPVTVFGYNVGEYFCNATELELPETQSGELLVEYRKKPRTVTIEEYEENTDAVLDVAEDVVMLLPYLVVHDLFLDDNPDVAVRAYNIYETERAKYIAERSERRTLFRRNTYKGW